jgi:hypothetical protein
MWSNRYTRPIGHHSGQKSVNKIASPKKIKLCMNNEPDLQAQNWLVFGGTYASLCMLSSASTVYIVFSKDLARFNFIASHQSFPGPYLDRPC